MNASTSENSGKAGKILFLFAFIGMAVWAAWGLMKMGADRAVKKAEAEASMTAGSGVVRPGDSAPASAAKNNSFETENQALLSAGTVEKTSVTPDPKVVVIPPAVVTPVLPEPAPSLPAPVVVSEPPAPAVLKVKTVPGAEVFEKIETASRSLGRADAEGNFSVDTLGVGDHRIVASHPDCLPAGASATVALRSGENAPLELKPEWRPGALIVLTDEGVSLRCEGRKYGAGATMIGNLPANRPISLEAIPAGGVARSESLTLAPRETRVLDWRTKPVTPVVAATPVSPATAEPVAPVAKPEVPAVATVPVEVVAFSRLHALVVLAREGATAAPLKPGDKGVLRLDGGEAEIVCVNLSGGLAVCQIDRDESGAGLKAGAKGRVEVSKP